MLAREIGASPEVVALEWMLMSTEPVGDFEAAVERVRWYLPMWDLEAFHRALKTGCQDRTRTDRGDLFSVRLGHDLVMGWRVYQLIKLGRGPIERPVTVGFEELEWQALVALVKKTPEPPKEPPTLREAVRMVGRMGGWWGRKGDGEPGAESLWQGLERIETMAQALELYRSSPEQGPESGAADEG